MKTYIRFERSKSDEVSEVYGPFDFVQLTYELLRVGPDGDEFAHYSNGWWQVIADQSEWSDVIIYGEEQYA